MVLSASFQYKLGEMDAKVDSDGFKFNNHDKLFGV